MPVYTFLTSDQGALIDLANIIEQNCRGGDQFEVRLAGRGFAGYRQAWNVERERLACKILAPVSIKVSRNHAHKDQHELFINREVTMNPNIIENIKRRLSSITGFDHADAFGKAKVSEKKDTLAYNFINSALADELIEHEEKIKELGNGPLYVVKIQIKAESDEARLFIAARDEYGSGLEKGIANFVRQGSENWPHVKSSASMIVEVQKNDMSDDSQNSDFLFKFDWSEAQGATHSGKVSENGKKTLRHPLKVTVLNGGSEPVMKTITHVPCRINRMSEGTMADICLADCLHVSGTHLVLNTATNDDLVVHELGSKHGSFVSGRDIRQNADSKHVIKPGTSTIVDLCLGNTPQQVEKNSRSSDRKTFPQLIIEYGVLGACTGTPELETGTPELDDAANW